MIEVTITQEQINLAKELTEKETKFNPNPASYGFDKKRIYIGHLGEKIVADYLNIQMDNTFEYDLISKKNKKLEVKSITCAHKPYMNYLAVVNSCFVANDKDNVRKQNADYYIFTRILNDESKAWIVGWISCKNFFELGTFAPKGSKFPGFSFDIADATVLEINKLNQFNKKTI